MAILRGVAFRFSVALLIANIALPAVAQEALCVEAIHQVAKQTSVPEAVLRAVAKIESGKAGSTSIGAWPWAVNQAGASQWLETADQAEEVINSSLQRGSENIDIGCFQINYRWHGSAFTSVKQMLDPLSNTRYAARFLQSLYDEYADWTVAAGKYHSRTPALAEAYTARFQAAITNVPQSSSRRANRYPYMQGGSGSGGSTVPMVTGVGSLFFLQTRSLIGY